MRGMSIATEAALPLVPSDEERLLRETVRGDLRRLRPEYARRKTPRASRPPSCGTRSPSRGYLGVNLPEEYGGGGLGMTGARDRRRGDRGGRQSLLLIVVSPAIVGSILVRHGTEEQKERWLRGIAAGTTKIAFAITEPDAGSNSHNLATSASAQGDGYVLRGEKTYISGVEDADAILVVARSRATTTASSGCRRS